MSWLCFLLAGLGILLMLCIRRKSAVALTPVFIGTFLFVGLMVGCLGCMNGGLCYIAVKIKKPLAAILFAVTFICCMCMGYLSSQDFTEAFMNWLAEIINILGQGALLAGALILHKAGLAAWQPEKNK